MRHYGILPPPCLCAEHSAMLGPVRYEGIQETGPDAPAEGGDPGRPLRQVGFHSEGRSYAALAYIIAVSLWCVSTTCPGSDWYRDAHRTRNRSLGRRGSWSLDHGGSNRDELR